MDILVVIVVVGLIVWMVVQNQKGNPGGARPIKKNITREMEERIREGARDWHADRARREAQARNRAAEEDAQQKLLKFALSCPNCRDYALPIPETKNRYHCPACGFQFAGDPHNL